MTTKQKTLKSLIADAKLDWVNSDIEKHFKMSEPRSEVYKLFHFDRYITSEDAVVEMEKEGYLPATLTELLYYANNGWNNDWVVALGSVAKVDGGRGVPYLDRYERDRSLYLHWWDVGWDGRCRFLAVRNSTLPLKTETSALGNLESLTLIAEIEERLVQLKKLI